MSKVSDERINQIIREHVNYSMVLAALPIPFVDLAGVMMVQLNMVRKLTGLFQVNFDKEIVKSAIYSILTSSLSRVGGQLVASLLKAIPGVGTILGLGTQVILSGASTYALGKAFEDHFKSGGTVGNMDISVLSLKFREFFDAGKRYAQSEKAKTDNEDVMDKLKKLKELKEMGAVTEEEYQKAKEKILNSL